MRLLVVLFASLLLAGAVRAADRTFLTSDGVRLHYIDQGPTHGPTLLFVPGWTMPAWIFGPQLQALSGRYHVVALDPRGQGDSDVPLSGYEPGRRGQDIAELIAKLGGPVVLVGWSLGVLDSLAYVHSFGDGQLAGLVLVDNSIGEDPAPVFVPRPARRGPTIPREIAMRRFVQSMFHRSPGEPYLERLTEASLRTPPDAAAALLAYPVPRSYWRDAVYSVRKPVLYLVTPRWAAQAANLAARDPVAETEVFAGSGHAMFVDEADRFDAVLQAFLSRRLGY